jgi:hypothetical protein
LFCLLHCFVGCNGGVAGVFRVLLNAGHSGVAVVADVCEEDLSGGWGDGAVVPWRLTCSAGYVSRVFATTAF